ncbi:junctophilin-like protein [Tasmannia lanceolata]|uniref:junctophilin-like protein n=1 Tax=Tasmannia lanceolata TaxID=3420 RepID=UPI0040645689
MAGHPSLISEIGPDGLVKESPIIAYTEKVIEEEQLQLKKYIEENYSKIRDVERELANLTFELKLTAGPKKAALEHLRKKIELSTERIRVAKLKEDEARKAWEAASKVVKDEEEVKQKLCEDLNRLVQESASTQFSRLEELKRRLEALNPSRASTSDIPLSEDVKLVQKAQINTVALNNTSHPLTSDSAGQLPENARRPGNNGDVSVVNGHNQLPIADGDGRGKKRSANLGRGKGNMVLSKGRGSLEPGWTGAGFDVDSRT